MASTTPKSAVSPARMSARNTPVLTTDQVFKSKDDHAEMENPFYQGVAEVPVVESRGARRWWCF